MTQSEKKRLRILIGGLVIVLGVFAADRFGLLGGESEPHAESGRTVARPPTPGAKSVVNRSSARGQQHERQGQDQLRTYVPLPLQAMNKAGATEGASGRNLFVYYVPPEPPRIEPPPPPPPLQIRSVEPRSVYAGTGDFRLRVVGMDLPEDARLFLNGRPMQATRSGPSELTMNVEKRLIAAPGQLRVEVRNTTGELYSNPLSVNVEAPPKPSYKFIGRIDRLVYLEKSKDERLIAYLGDVVENRWRVSQVENENVVLEDVSIGIQHTINMEDRSSVSGGPVPVTSNPRFVPVRNNLRQQMEEQEQSEEPVQEPDEAQGEPAQLPVQMLPGQTQTQPGQPRTLPGQTRTLPGRPLQPQQQQNNRNQRRP